MRVKVGLVGAGHLGSIHLKCLRQVPDIELVGFYEQDPVRATEIAADHSIPAFASYTSLLDAVEAVDIVTPTPTHFALAQQALRAGKHVFIEKPVTSEVSEADVLWSLQKEKQLIVQVGHVERFNPAWLAIKDVALDPKFIEVHRLAHFNPRGTDVSVVLDLMIHDLDIILSMVPSRIKQVQASGVNLVSLTPDIGNARIEWENGCVANVTASRMSLKNMRKMRVFQPGAYIGLDFLERSAQIIRLSDGAAPEDADLQTFTLDTANGPKTVHIEMPETPATNAIEMELALFAQSVLAGTRPDVSIQEARAALALAHQISSIIEAQAAALPS